RPRHRIAAHSRHVAGGVDQASRRMPGGAAESRIAVMSRASGFVLALILLAFAVPAMAEKAIDVNKELTRLRELGTPQGPTKAAPGFVQDLNDVLKGYPPEIHIGNAEYRVAVFEFEDPDNSGLGSAVSSLIAREVLLRTELRSFGVLRYYGSLRPSV